MSRRSSASSPERLVLIAVVALVGVGIQCYRNRNNSAQPVSGNPPVSGRPSPPRTGAPTSGGQASASEQMLLGNPDGAATNAAQRDKYLIVRPQYALSYNDDLHIPNWVAWHLSAADIGPTERGQFRPDPELPAGFTVITTRDYSGTGFDRGHNCPSKDRSATREDNDAVFYMTNMTPQMHAMNAGPWENLERYCRTLAERGSECYIICGHGFDSRNRPRIGRAQIAKPDWGWKIVVALPLQDGDDRARIAADTRVIAIKVPNVDGIERNGWSQYITTVAEIERATGLHVFDALPIGVADALRTKRDAGEGSFGGGDSGFTKTPRRTDGSNTGGSFGGGKRR